MIGLFEWVVWGELVQMDVFMLYGEAPVSVREFVAAALPPLATESSCYVLAVRLDDTGGMRVAGLVPGQQANHFVWATLSDEPLPSVVVPAGVGDDALAAARMLGWIPMPTNATGDCGPDTMAAAAGLPRTAAGWLAVRTALATFMEEVSADEVWQTVCACCHEVDTPAVVASGSSSSAAAQPLPAPPLPPPASPEATDDDSIVAAAPPLARPLAEAPVVQAASPRDSEISSDNKDGPGRVSFPEWLRALPPHELSSALVNLASAKAAEDRWRAAHPPVVRTHVLKPARSQPKLAYKRALAEAYSRWTVGPGAASKAKSKEPRQTKGTLR
jgi:hypothetical protein